MTGDRARERGAENRADAPIHLIKRLQELGAGKYALFTYSLSPFIFFVAKKRKTGKLGEKKEKEKENEKGSLPREIFFFRLKLGVQTGSLLFKLDHFS